MFALIQILTGAKAVVPLVPGIIDIVEKLRQNNQDPNLNRVVAQVRLDALESIHKLRSELTELLQDDNLYSQLNLKLRDAGDNLSWLADPIKKWRVQRCRDRIDEVHRELSKSTDDLAAILACMQKLDGLGNVYATAEDVRVELDKLLLDEPSLGEAIQTYIKFLDDYAVRLQG